MRKAIHFRLSQNLVIASFFYLSGIVPPCLAETTSSGATASVRLTVPAPDDGTTKIASKSLAAGRPDTAAGGGGKEASARRVRLVKPASMAAFDRAIVGFNSEMAATGGAGGNYEAETLRTGIDKLPVGALRYPGGSVANFFDWQTETLDVSALKQAGKHRMLEGVERDKERNRGKLTRVDLTSFFQAVNRLEARAFLVLNLLTVDQNTVIRTIDSVKARHGGPVYWELGNELFQEEYSKKLNVPGGWDQDIYAKKAAAVARHIRATYPKDRIGVVASELATGRLPGKGTAFLTERGRKEWDTAVAAIGGTDAVIVHPYVFLQREVREKLRSIDSPRDRVTGADLETENAWRWVFACVQELPRLYMDRISERFPGKSVWITETGIAQEHVVKQPVEEQQTALRFIADTAYFISWTRYYPKVETLLFHGLFWGSGWSAALYPDYSYNANGLSYAFIREALRGAGGIAWLDIAESPTYQGIGLYAETAIKALSGIYIKGAGGDRLLLVNSGKDPVTVETPFKQFRIISYGGDPRGVIRPGKLKQLSDLSMQTVPGSVGYVPGFSVALFVEALPGSK